MKQIEDPHITVLTEPWQIECARLASAKAAIKLEEYGMRHSRLGSLRKRWALHLGLKPNAKHQEVVDEIQKQINHLMETNNVQP